MEFTFGTREEQLRSEIRAFLHDNLPPDWKKSSGSGFSLTPDELAFVRAHQRKLGARRWLVPAWPAEYGGFGASIAEQMVFADEFGYAGSPSISVFGTGLLGPTLMVHG